MDKRHAAPPSLPHPQGDGRDAGARQDPPEARQLPPAAAGSKGPAALPSVTVLTAPTDGRPRRRAPVHLPPGEANASRTSLNLPAGLLAAIGNPSRVRVDVCPENGIVYLCAGRGSRSRAVSPNGQRARQLTFSRHGLALGRHPARALDGWLIEIFPEAA